MKGRRLERCHLDEDGRRRRKTQCQPSWLEHAGLDQERRALVANPGDMSWEWPQADSLVLAFSLPAGTYATSVLNEILLATEPERRMESEPAALE